MYFLFLKLRILQPATLVFRGVYFAISGPYLNKGATVGFSEIINKFHLDKPFRKDSNGSMNAG